MDNKAVLTSLFYNKILLYLEKIYEHLEKIDISYKVNMFEKNGFENEHDLSNIEYPYRHYWIDYIKTTKLFFKKIEGYNSKSIIESSTNSSNKFGEYKIINNELAIMFEENNLIQSLLLLIVN